MVLFFFSSRRRHTRLQGDWSSDVCSSDLGVRGLLSLIILQHLMQRVNPESPPKPCEYFDLIGGTSTGGGLAFFYWERVGEGKRGDLGGGRVIKKKKKKNKMESCTFKEKIH